MHMRDSENTIFDNLHYRVLLALCFHDLIESSFPKHHLLGHI